MTDGARGGGGGGRRIDGGCLLFAATAAAAAGAGQTLTERRFEVHQLAHEVEVGGDVRLAAAQELVGVVEGQGQLGHQVGDRDGDRSTDAGQAVDEDAVLSIATFV